MWSTFCVSFFLVINIEFRTADLFQSFFCFFILVFPKSICTFDKNLIMIKKDTRLITDVYKGLIFGEDKVNDNTYFDTFNGKKIKPIKYVYELKELIKQAQ